MSFLFPLMKEQTYEPTIQTSSGTQILVPTAPISHKVNIDIENIIIPPIASGLTTARVHAAFGWSRFCCFCHKGERGQQQGSPGSLCAPDDDREEQRHHTAAECRGVRWLGTYMGQVTLRCRSQQGTPDCCGLIPTRSPSIPSSLVSSAAPSLCAEREACGGRDKRYMELLEEIQQRIPNLAKGLQNLSYQECLRELGPLQPREGVTERGPHQCDYVPKGWVSRR